MNEALSGKTALITGGSRGIGAAIAKNFASQGANIVINGRERDAEVDGFLASFGEDTSYIFVQGDASDPTMAGHLVTETLRRFGQIDFLVHAAGGAVPGSILDVSEEDWMAAFSVHIHAIFHLFRAAHASLASTKGSVLLLSSVAGLRGCPNTIGYQTVKGALPQMARALARDHGAEGIRVNAIAPGIIETRFHEAMTAAARQNNLENRIPLRSFGSAEQVASASVELMTNGFITGETLVIDGGMSMRMV